eukprot:CAMPEP_0177526784 /NCGR_PEP_ID=MMETSP0369-20130122/51272_1 /TAXON_ID=447022 ORGANISM="Scrippsiella hangoei-like, Strain SHHI-4" /NCGR_SAMPLE_ID=MMETSP0369 /ASSEMBLY_ACC=CAM_ASM_000364 /LENGTH=198 /DNA_ID=CAMNT_0019007039 /DNA_START=505 /DNA_END=1099 /DNA_ORIENTATION=-
MELVHGVEDAVAGALQLVGGVDEVQAGRAGARHDLERTCGQAADLVEEVRRILNARTAAVLRPLVRLEVQLVRFATRLVLVARVDGGRARGVLRRHALRRAVAARLRPEPVHRGRGVMVIAAALTGLHCQNANKLALPQSIDLPCDCQALHDACAWASPKKRRAAAPRPSPDLQEHSATAAPATAAVDTAAMAAGHPQ